MRLLITTQTVDQNDPALSFFHHWLLEFAKHCEHIEVICLQEGKHALPPNVTLHSLGKTKGKKVGFFGKIVRRMRYALRVLSLSWKLRREYDAVFVHMNPEYMVLCGFLWKFLKKKSALWYTHKMVDTKLRLAESFADIIFTASKESFRLPSKKVQVMGHGIDTDFWTPDDYVVREGHWLSVGRLMPVKKHDEAMKLAHKERVLLRIAGEGPERRHLEDVANRIGGEVQFLGPCTESELRDEYRRAGQLIHISTGSLDKVVLEAASCECPVFSTDEAIQTLPLSRVYVQENHSLPLLIPRLLKAYE